MTIKLPDVLPGHWHTKAGHEMAERYAETTRKQLSGRHYTDFELASEIYMDCNSIVFQTAAKKRMRWLSVQLAISNELLKQARSTLEMILETDSSDELLKAIDAQLANNGIKFTD